MLGVLGGMGPMATVDFMGKVVRNTPAACDQAHIPMLVCSDAAIPDRTAAILGTGADPLPALIRALRRLETAGASVVAMPCNTAHHWHAALQGQACVPILHIVDAVAAVLARRGVAGPVGLLATDGTLAAGLYPARLGRHGVGCRAPDAAGQEAVMRAIRLVKAGDCAQARGLLLAQAEVLVEAGCGAVVMACTEIPVALTGAEAPVAARLVDATEALAQACVAAFHAGQLPQAA